MINSNCSLIGPGTHLTEWGRKAASLTDADQTTQSFRLDGGTQVVNIACDQDDGQNVIYWHDIVDIFPGIQHVKNGDVAIKRLKTLVITGKTIDENTSSTPVGEGRVVLDVILSTSTAVLPDSLLEEDSGALQSKEMALLTPNKARGSVFEHRLISSLPPDIQAQVLASSDVHGSIVQAIHSGKVDRLHEQLIACWQDLKNETTKSNDLASGNNTLVANVKDLMLKNMELSTNMTKMQEAFGAKQEEVKQLQTQALGQLALLRVQALVAQTFELYEYSIPRLFVVLLQDTSSQDPTNLFSNKFRLYFLCECGGHTKLTDPKVPHDIHLAKHE
ncbi:hypothetical protein BGX31_010196 [Mortierella sp. GBA43]|nr:hypothetical protein BGX31_010196 [Mortierella sp. GBA43]